MLLRIDHLSKSFRGLEAVVDFNLSLKDGEILSIIGPNGAGKTTVFNLITGFYAPDTGSIFFHQEEITNLKPYLVAAKGIARTFQNIRLFGNLSVLENVRVAFHFQRDYQIAGAILRSRRYREEEERIKSGSLYLLRMFKLEERCNEMAGNLSYGEQRKLEIVRALATGARLILLDEPTAGMNHSEQEEAIRLIRWVRDEFKLTILLIEHQMKVVMSISERIVVMNFGRIIAEGTPGQIQRNPDVIEAYLGQTDA